MSATLLTTFCKKSASIFLIATILCGKVLAQGSPSAIAIQLATTDTTVTEGEAIELPITLINRESNDDIVLAYNVITSGLASINPNDRSGQVTISISESDQATLNFRTLRGDYGPNGQLVNVDFFDQDGRIGFITFTVIDDPLIVTVQPASTEFVEGQAIIIELFRSGGPAELTLGYNVTSGSVAIDPADRSGEVFDAGDTYAALFLSTLLGDYGEDGQQVTIQFFAPADGTFPGGLIQRTTVKIIENDKDNGPNLEFVRHETPITFDSNIGYHETLEMFPPLTEGGYRIEFSMHIGTYVPDYLPILVRGETDANDIEIYLQPQNGFANIAVVHNRGNGGSFDFVTYELKFRS